jgi:hypothetical protein
MLWTGSLVLDTIARRRTVERDRAHVMIAGALLGKRAEYHGTNFHTVTAIAAARW